MKKNIFIFCTVLIASVLMAFGYKNWNDAEKPDLVYNIDSRFMATISKENLHKATSVVDVVPKESEWSKVSFLNMTVAVLQDGGEIHEVGDNEVFNEDQIKLLQSIDYSTHFYLKGRGKRKGAGPDGLKDNKEDEFDFAYYLTVIPEKEAEYTAGYDALITYLKRKSKEATAIIEQDKIQPGRVNFTVTKTGAIENVLLDSSSGYPSVDKKMVGLISNLPKKWNPATNSKGEKVDQELVFFFGVQGC